MYIYIYREIFLWQFQKLLYGMIKTVYKNCHGGGMSMLENVWTSWIVVSKVVRFPFMN